MSKIDTNLFNDSAIILGVYAMDTEWDMVKDEYVPMPQDEFIVWIKGYCYYHGLVCKSLGNTDEIDTQLEADYKELNDTIPYDISQILLKEED